LDLLHSVALLRQELRPQCPPQHRMLSAARMELSSKSRAVMVTAIWGAAVGAIITVGAEAAATTMVGDIIAIGGEPPAILKRSPQLAAFLFQVQSKTRRAWTGALTSHPPKTSNVGRATGGASCVPLTSGLNL